MGLGGGGAISIIGPDQSETASNGACMSACIYICMYVCIYVCICMFVYIHVCKHHVRMYLALSPCPLSSLLSIATKFEQNCANFLSAGILPGDEVDATDFDSKCAA